MIINFKDPLTVIHCETLDDSRNLSEYLDKHKKHLQDNTRYIDLADEELNNVCFDYFTGAINSVDYYKQFSNVKIVDYKDFNWSLSIKEAKVGDYVRCIGKPVFDLVDSAKILLDGEPHRITAVDNCEKDDKVIYLEIEGVSDGLWPYETSQLELTEFNSKNCLENGYTIIIEEDSLDKLNGHVNSLNSEGWTAVDGVAIEEKKVYLQKLVKSK